MGLPPHEDHTSNLVGPVRGIIGRLGWRRLFRVPGGEAHRTKMSYVHGGHAPEDLIDLTDSWGTLGAHVVAARGTCRARVAGTLSVRRSVAETKPRRRA